MGQLRKFREGQTLKARRRWRLVRRDTEIDFDDDDVQIELVPFVCGEKQ